MAVGFRDGSFVSPQNMTVVDAGEVNPNRLALESSSVLVDKFLQQDNNFAQYHDLLWCTPFSPSVSGLRETDYPNLKDFTSTMRSVNHVSGLTTIPLPVGLEEQFNHMQFSCDMGLFPEINRAWLTIDSNLFLWAYDNGADIAFYDRLTETILGVGLIKPKKGVFKEHISFLLVLTTTVEIQLLGVMASDADDFANIHIILEPMFTFPTDNVHFSVVTGTDLGRVFLGGKDGSLVECVYRQEEGWFTKKSWKTNHSASFLTSHLPSFLNFSLEDPIEQIEVDNSRKILFTRSEKGTIDVYDLGLDGMETSKVTSLSANCIVSQAANVARTVDHSNFRSIVHISAFEESESTVINLMAVTETGVRMYFTTSRGNYEVRPSTLSLVHIRLPPGFSASSGFQRPTRVHLCYHRRGTTIMLSPESQEKDMLWLLTNDPFPFCRELMEISAALPLHSRVWKMVEEKKKQVVQPLNCIRIIGSDRTVSMEPPLLVTQDIEEPRKFVFLTSQGIHLAYKPRPIDHLKKILSDNQGFDNEAVRGFFTLYGEDQASCCAISLACCQMSAQDRQIAEWATLAFFRFTKDLESGTTNQMNQSVTVGQQMSTPINRFSRPQIQSPASPLAFSPPSIPASPDNMEVAYPVGDPTATEMSCRHNSLYLFFSRIVRPVWNYGVVVSQTGSSPEVVASSVEAAELIVYIDKLKNLKAFIQKHHPLRNPRNAINQFPRTCREREALSLSNLVILIESSLEIFGLWKILNDHHFYSFASQLPQDILNRMKSVTFKDLIINGQELCGKLASCLVQKFIDDNDTTDAISTRLNEACPSVFKQENALFAKAQEMIMRAKVMTNQDEKEKQIEEAAKLLNRIGARIPLLTACHLLQSVRAYDHVINLCISTAGLRDPQNQAIVYYKNNEPHNDFTGATLFASRMECYRVLLECLQELIDRSKMTVHPSRSSPSLTDTRTFADLFTREESANLANYILQESMKTNDELFHVACFDWLFRHSLTDRLLQIKSPFLEEYLKRKTTHSGDASFALMDLLWMFYERNGHHRAAAEILVKLAERSGADADLNARRQYLSRAIVCMKSQNSLSFIEKESKHSGEFLHELEEKMEVARLQSEILETLKKMGPSAAHVVTELESGLYDITQLYEKADQFNLAEHQLHIIHVANHDDPVLIEGFWKKILENEILKSPDSKTARMAIEAKLRELARLYLPSEKFFPVSLLIETLESRGPILIPGGEATWLADILVKIGFPFPLLVDNYHCIYKTTGGRYTWPGKECQLLTIMHHLMYHCASASNPVDR